LLKSISYFDLFLWNAGIDTSWYWLNHRYTDLKLLFGNDKGRCANEWELRSIATMVRVRDKGWSTNFRSRRGRCWIVILDNRCRRKWCPWVFICNITKLIHSF
jgi:hypothetical protein